MVAARACCHPNSTALLRTIGAPMGRRRQRRATCRCPPHVLRNAAAGFTTPMGPECTVAQGMRVGLSTSEAALAVAAATAAVAHASGTQGQGCSSSSTVPSRCECDNIDRVAIPQPRSIVLDCASASRCRGGQHARRTLPGGDRELHQCKQSHSTDIQASNTSFSPVAGCTGVPAARPLSDRPPLQTPLLRPGCCIRNKHDSKRYRVSRLTVPPIRPCHAGLLSTTLRLSVRWASRVDKMRRNRLV